MPVPSPIPEPSPIPSPTGTISYPVERLLNTAQQIRRNAHQALSTLAGQTNTVANYILEFPETMQGSLSALFEMYNKRVEHSYSTQLLFASWLELAAYQMQQTDGQITTTFRQFLTEVDNNQIRPNY